MAVDFSDLEDWFDAQRAERFLELTNCAQHFLMRGIAAVASLALRTYEPLPEYW